MANTNTGSSTESEELIETPLRTATYELLGDGLFKLTLTRENKAEIFEHAISQLHQSQREASFILQNLTKWSPSVAAVFEPRSAPTFLDTPFRLIFPNAALPWFDETGFYVRQYMAVSYCWHSEDFLSQGYKRHGDWPISKPFVDAIISDKDHPRVGIWMDQLCIDQSSSIDKQRSVAAMDLIYRSCIRLLVLLEDVFLDEREVALGDEYDPSKTTYDKTRRPPMEEMHVLASFYHKVNSARWWERAWCFHEFNVNEPWSDKRQCHEIHNATFVMNGPRGTTVKMKWYTLQVIMGSALEVMPDIANNAVTELKGQAIFAGVNGRDDRENGWRSSLMSRHNGISQKGCMHLEDRLSIMINMCGLGLAYRGHALDSKEEVLYFSALLALAAGEVYPLTVFHRESTIKLDNQATWLQQHLVPYDTSMPRFRLGGINGIHRVSKAEIELDMVFLAPPAMWEKVKDENLRSTYEIFPETIITIVPPKLRPEDYSVIEWEDRPDSILDQVRRGFLAGCIMNGHPFTARLWAQLKRDVVIPHYNDGQFKDLAPNPHLHTPAQKFMAQLLPISTPMNIPPPSDFTLEDAHLFLTWLTDPRSVYYISAYTYRVQCTLDGQGAFITATRLNEHFAEGPPEELQAALPTDLLGTSCMPLRVWLLRPGDTKQGVSKWRIVGKALLLGEPDLMSEARGSEGRVDAVVRLRERTIVGG